MKHSILDHRPDKDGDDKNGGNYDDDDDDDVERQR